MRPGGIRRRHLTGSFPIKLETNRVIAAVFLDGLRSGRGADFIDRYRERVGAISHAAVNEAARQLGDPAGLVMASAGTRDGC